MKIGGFNIPKKGIIIVVVIFAVIFGISKFNSYKQQKELEERNRIAQEQIAQQQAMNQPVTQQESISLHDQIQAQLTESFGVAPEGFEWDYSGNLIALGDGSMTAEEVIYTFLRTLSMLDFASASRYSSNSITINNYQSYFGVSSMVITDYYDNFLRKQYKISIESLEVTGTGSVSIFADGTEYITVMVRALDLTDKDFWRKDREDLFETMYAYRETENDDAKLEQYLYDYILEKYEDGSIGKRDATIELVVEKSFDGGWLVTNDKELDAILEYEQGLDTARYIMNEFNDWYIKEVVDRSVGGY